MSLPDSQYARDREIAIRGIPRVASLLALCSSVWLLGCSKRETPALPREGISDADARAFLQAFDSAAPPPGGNRNLKWDERLAASYGISTPPPPRSWRAILDQSLHTSWRSRQVLQSAAGEWGTPFLLPMYEVYSGGTDAFTECRLALLMIDELPADRRTAQYTLSVAERHWRSAWPENFDLHGNRPRDAIRLEILPKIWVIPGRPWAIADDELPRWLRRAASDPESWRYDPKLSQWRAGT